MFSCCMMSDQRSPEAGGGQGKGKQRVAWNLLFIPESRVTVVTLDKNRRGEEGGFLPFRKDNIQTQGGKSPNKELIKIPGKCWLIKPKSFSVSLLPVSSGGFCWKRHPRSRTEFLKRAKWADKFRQIRKVTLNPQRFSWPLDYFGG